MALSHLKVWSILAASTVFLAGCGFKPMYGDASYTAQLQDIRVETGETRVDYLLQEALQDELGAQAGQGRYLLETLTDLNTSRLGVGADDVATRYAVSLQVDYQLVDTQTGDAVLVGRETVEAAYNDPRQVYGALAAQRSAEAQAARLAAERIALDLARAIIDQSE